MSDTQQTAPRRGRKRFEIAVHVGGTTTTLRALAKQRGLSYQMVRGRIERLGWPLEQALATPASAWRRDRRAQALPEDNAEDSTQAPHPADGCESCERLAAKIARLEAEREHIRDSLRFEVGDVWQIGTACTVITVMKTCSIVGRSAVSR